MIYTGTTIGNGFNSIIPERIKNWILFLIVAYAIFVVKGKYDEIRVK
jgi:hypothetical protein